MAAPQLASNTLATPQEYDEIREFRGGTVVLADGTQHTDLVQAAAKRRFRLVWNTLTAAQKATLQTAFDSMVTGGSATFVDMASASYTVTRDGDTDLDFRYVRTASGTRYAATLALREA